MLQKFKTCALNIDLAFQSNGGLTSPVSVVFFSCIQTCKCSLSPTSKPKGFHASLPTCVFKRRETNEGLQRNRYLIFMHSLMNDEF